MSIYSGKCDVFDEFVAILEMNDNSDWSKINLYQYDENLNRIKLNIKSLRDLTPYYPFLIQTSCSHDGFVNACITSSSYVDIEYKERLYFKYKMAKKEYMRCKRLGIVFDTEEAAKKISFNRNSYELEKEICKRVKAHPFAKPNFRGLEDTSKNWQKEILIEEMVNVGYTKEQAELWCYKNIKTWYD